MLPCFCSKSVLTKLLEDSLGGNSHTQCLLTLTASSLQQDGLQAVISLANQMALVENYPVLNTRHVKVSSSPDLSAISVFAQYSETIPTCSSTSKYVQCHTRFWYFFLVMADCYPRHTLELRLIMSGVKLPVLSCSNSSGQCELWYCRFVSLKPDLVFKFDA